MWDQGCMASLYVRPYYLIRKNQTKGIEIRVQKPKIKVTNLAAVYGFDQEAISSPSRSLAL
jgi:ABC-type transporter Mla MlaB component